MSYWMSGWSMLHLTIFFFFLHSRQWRLLIFVGLLPGETYLMCIHWNFELNIVSIALRWRCIWGMLMGLAKKVDWICIYFEWRRMCSYFGWLEWRRLEWCLKFLWCVRIYLFCWMIFHRRDIYILKTFWTCKFHYLHSRNSIHGLKFFVNEGQSICLE